MKLAESGIFKSKQVYKGDLKNKVNNILRCRDNDRSAGSGVRSGIPKHACPSLALLALVPR